VLQQGEEDVERLRKNGNGIGSAGGGGEGEWQRFLVGRKMMATNGCSSPVLKQTPLCFQILSVFPPSIFLFVFFFKIFFLPSVLFYSPVLSQISHSFSVFKCSLFFSFQNLPPCNSSFPLYL
jgi:hypothetical protein